MTKIDVGVATLLPCTVANAFNTYHGYDAHPDSVRIIKDSVISQNCASLIILGGKFPFIPQKRCNTINVYLYVTTLPSIVSFV